MYHTVSIGIPYVISSLIAGFAGLILITRVNAAFTSLGTGCEIDVILAVILGGSFFRGKYGNPIGALFGALIVVALKNILSLMNADISYQYAITGVLLILGLAVNYGYNAIVGLLYRQSKNKTAGASV